MSDPSPAKRERGSLPDLSSLDTRADEANKRRAASIYVLAHYLPHSNEQLALNVDGTLDTSLPRRSEIVRQLYGTHKEFNFQTRCNWDDAINSFQEGIFGDAPTTVVLDKATGEVIAVATFDMDNTELFYQRAKETLQKDAKFGYEPPLEDRFRIAGQNLLYVYVGYACSSPLLTRGPRSAEPRLRGAMRFLLDGIAVLFEKFYVQPLVKSAIFNRWLEDFSTEALEQKVRSYSFFSLFSVPSAKERWASLGFEYVPGTESEMFREIFVDGKVPVPVQPIIVSP